MIVPDVNVLVYAFDTGSDRHTRTAAWLADAVAAEELVALPESVLAGFARIVTDRRILTNPATITSAMQFVAALLDAPATQLLVGSRATWRLFEELVAADPSIVGNSVPDGYLAALALSHGGRIATADRGFSRYSSLNWFDPTQG